MQFHLTGTTTHALRDRSGGGCRVPGHDLRGRRPHLGAALGAQHHPASVNGDESPKSVPLRLRSTARPQVEHRHGSRQHRLGQRRSHFPSLPPAMSASRVAAHRPSSAARLRSQTPREPRLNQGRRPGLPPRPSAAPRTPPGSSSCPAAGSSNAHAWVMHTRRHARHYERHIQHSESLITWAAITLMTMRITRRNSRRSGQRASRETQRD